DLIDRAVDAHRKRRSHATRLMFDVASNPRSRVELIRRMKDQAVPRRRRRRVVLDTEVTRRLRNKPSVCQGDIRALEVVAKRISVATWSSIYGADHDRAVFLCRIVD